MLHNKTITVVIPTLNEAGGIRHTLGLVPKFVDEVIVVDGDSTDKTREIAAECGAKVVLEKRRGYGRAFKTGFAHATSEIIATADGDATYPIEALEAIIDHLLNKKLEFISCARFPLQDRSSMRKRNYIGNYLMSKAASVLWVHNFSDILSGMWVFRREVLAKLDLYSDSWNLSEEIKLQAHMRLGSKFAEYQIPYRERIGETKLVPWKVGIQNLAYMMTMRVGQVPLVRGVLGRSTDR